MIFVTGASGNVGSQLVKLLNKAGGDYRFGARTVDRFEGDDRAVRFDFYDRSTFDAAVAGVDAVFLLRPPAISNTKATLNVFLDAARRAAVAKVVFISVAGAGNMPFIPHHAVEKHLVGGPPGWTILRAGFFSQNLGGAYRRGIRYDNQIYLPAGKGRVAFTDTRDIAEVAVMALTNPAEHRGKIYTLTGFEALSFAEVAELLSAELRRPISYNPASVPGYIAHLFSQKAPLSLALVQTLLHVGLRFGQGQTADPTLEHLLGRLPTRVHDYIHTNRSLWVKP